MKKNIFRFLIILAIFIVTKPNLTVAQDLNTAGPAGGPVIEKIKKETRQYSPLASELIEAYQLPKRGLGKPQPRVLAPPRLSKEHLTSKYRPGWEELLLDLVGIHKITSEERKITDMEPRIFEALKTISSPESIPALVEAFRRTAAKGIDPTRAIILQEKILRTMVEICDKKSLEATFALLDFADESTVGKEWELKHEGHPLREAVFYLWIQPTNLGEYDFKKERLSMANKWQVLINDYNNPKLSKKNQELLKKVKMFKRPKPEPQKSPASRLVPK
jgi:hypothetical protein